MSYSRTTVLVVALAAAIEAAGLTLLLGAANRPLSLGAWIELCAALGWIAVVTNGAVAVVLAGAWLVVRGRAALDPRAWTVFLAGGLLAAHVAWALLNRLTLAQTWMRPPGFLTVDGLAQLVAIGTVGALLLLAGYQWHPRHRASYACLAAASLLAVGCVAWARHDEARGRSYAPAEIRQAAWAGAPVVRAPVGGTRPLLFLGFDGMGWAIAKPLLEAGLLPNFAALIRDGAVGALDNGDHSYSPIIWNTIYTGRPASEHGIFEFRNVQLPRSGEQISNLLMMSPSLHSLYGVRHLFERIPNPGLWSIRAVRSTDRRAKTVWEVGAAFGKTVVVVDPVTSMPLAPIEMTAIRFLEPFHPSVGRPPTIAAAWEIVRASVPYSWGEALASEDPLAKLWERESVQNEFARQLFASRRFDLGVFYSDWIDDLAHLHWSFFSDASFLLTDLPDGMTNAQWERLVVAHRDAPPIRAFQETDAFVGRLRDLFDADFVVVSDHGWAFDGYLHYGSPDGVVILSGPSFRAGVNLADVRIEDVAPTMLSVLGVPLSRELSGRVVSEALAGAPQTTSVEAYGAPVRADAAPVEAEDAQLERLRALGYVQ